MNLIDKETLSTCTPAIYKKTKSIRDDYDRIDALKCIIDDIVYNYAYVYTKNKKIIFLSVGESYISSDGDYKRNLIQMISFNKKEEEILDILEEYTIHKLREGMRFISPNFIAKRRLDVKVFNIAFLYFGIFHLGWPVLQNHVNPMYERLFDIKAFRHYLYDLIKPNYSHKFYANIICKMNQLFRIEPDLRFGQKIVPLHLKEVCDITLTSSAWKEVYINEYTNKLVLENHGNFSYSIGWDITTRDEDPKDFLSNYYLIDHMYTNASTKATLQKIEAWKKFEGISNISAVINKEEHLKDVYDGDYILMFNSWVGMPYYSYIKTDLETDMSHPIYRKIHPLLDADDFARYWFDLVYDLNCLNAQGIIHGDLHLNNFTIYAPPERSPLRSSKLAYDPSGQFIAYQNIKKDKYYVLSHKLYYTYIIDFSRAILNPNQHTFDDEYRDFQNLYILEVFERFFPDLYSQNKPAIIGLLGNPEFFKVMCAFDIYSSSLACMAFMVNEKVPGSSDAVKGVASSNFYAAVIKQELPKKFAETLRKQFDLICRLNDFAKEFILDNTTALIHRATHIVSWPNEMAFKIFDGYLKEKKDVPPLLDYIELEPVDEMKKSFKQLYIDSKFMAPLQKKKCTASYRRGLLELSF